MCTRKKGLVKKFYWGHVFFVGIEMSTKEGKKFRFGLLVEARDETHAEQRVSRADRRACVLTVREARPLEEAFYSLHVGAVRAVPARLMPKKVPAKLPEIRRPRRKTKLWPPRVKLAA